MEITGSAMLKPVYTAPHPLAGEKVPLTVFDRAALDMFVPMVLAYPAPAPSNAALKEGLLRAVAPSPHLAGRLPVDSRGRRFIHVNDEGVLVIEATVAADLTDVLVGGRMAGSVDDLYPKIPEENVGAALLQVKLNRYKYRGLVIGVSYHHHTADGVAMDAFLTTWARAVREGNGFTVPSLFLDRGATAVPRSTPKPAFDHRSIEFKAREDNSNSSKSHDAVLSMYKMKNLAVHFPAEFIADLKARVGFRCSTFQCLLAHAWKKLTVARGLKSEEFTQVKVAVNCRGKASSPVPTEFFGNMVLWAFPRLQARDVLSWSYGRVVGAIRDAVARVDEEYIQSFVDFGAVADANGEELQATAGAGTMLCPDIEVDSWLGFKINRLDFGTGTNTVFLPPDLPIEGLLVFVPSCTEMGAVDLVLAVAEDHLLLLGSSPSKDVIRIRKCHLVISYFLSSFDEHSRCKSDKEIVPKPSTYVITNPDFERLLLLRSPPSKEMPDICLIKFRAYYTNIRDTDQVKEVVPNSQEVTM